MNTFKNINDIVSDTKPEFLSVPTTHPREFQTIPSVGDEVLLDMNDKKYAIKVKVTEISEDKETFRGKVTHGYYPEDKKEWIDVGDLVEFSREKIGIIYQK